MGNVTQLKQGSLNGLRRQTNECLENAYNKGYQDGKKESYADGLEDGKADATYNTELIEELKQEEYNRGLVDARLILLRLLAIPSGKYVEMFNNDNCYYLQAILSRYSISEIEDKIKIHEDKKKVEEEIKVGDFIKDKANERTGIVLSIGMGRYAYLTEDNKVYTNTLDSLEKLNRNVADKLQGLFESEGVNERQNYQ